MYKLQSKNLVIMPVSLLTQTELHNLTLQVQNAELTSIDSRYNFLTSVSLCVIIQSTDLLSNSTSALLEFSV